MQFITKLQTHCLSKVVTAIIVLTHLNHDISHYCGDYSASINHKGLIFLTGLLAREPRQDIMPCSAILHCSVSCCLCSAPGCDSSTGHAPAAGKPGPCSCNEHPVAKPWGFAWMPPEWAAAEPRLGCPTGIGKLLAVPPWPPMLLLKHWDSPAKWWTSSPAGQEGLWDCADSGQLGEVRSANQLLSYFVTAPATQNRMLTAATYLNWIY